MKLGQSTALAVMLLLGIVLAVAALKSFVALSAAMLDPGCLAGHSAEGLPYIAPAIACILLLGRAWALSEFKVSQATAELKENPPAVALGRGWALFIVEQWKWRLLSLAYILGASMFATTPLARSLGVVLWPWELVPMFLVCGGLLVEGWQAMRSRWRRFRALAICTAVAIACAVVAPWVPQLAENFPDLVIAGVYGSPAAVIFADLYCHRLTTRRQPA